MKREKRRDIEQNVNLLTRQVVNSLKQKNTTKQILQYSLIVYTFFNTTHNNM
jgi:hypothetical protein